MGQAEVWTFMEKHPNTWFTSYDIEKKSGIPRNNAGTALSKLRKFGIVYREIRYEKHPHKKTNSLYNVRYYKLVPKGKFVTFDTMKDTLNKTGKTEFYY